MAYPSKRPENIVDVNSISGLSGQLKSNVTYNVVGNLDFGSGSINVPEGGLIITASDPDICSLNSSGTLFTYDGAYAGKLKLSHIQITSPYVFDLDNSGNSDELNCQSVNFFGCASLGKATAYRQGLFTDVGVLNCVDGLETAGAWSGGFASLDSIVVIGSFTGTLFKRGAGFSMAGSFRSNMNALGLAAGGQFCDYTPADIISDAGFLMEGVRTGIATNPFPNMPASSVKARYNDCSGTPNTYIGGSVTMTALGDTTFSVINTLQPITATGAAYDLAWFEANGSNGLKYISSQPVKVSVSGTLSFSGANNVQMAVQIRKYDDSTSSYVAAGPEYVSTLNGGQAGTRAENVSFKGSVFMDLNDRIEIWIKNKDGTSTISTLANGEFSITTA